MTSQHPPAAAKSLLPAGAVPAGVAHNPYWNNMPSFSGPMMGGFVPFNQLAAYAAAQENALPMVAIAKLASSKSKSSTNSSLVVRGSLRRANTHGGTLSVAEWTRKTLEENLEWLVKLVKRHAEGEKAIFLSYGDGCETLLLLDGKVIDSPDDLKTVKKIPVGCSMAEIDSNFDEEKLAAMGVLQPKDSIWEHLRFETIGAIKPQADEKSPKGLFIHTQTSVFDGSVDGRRRILQLTTGANLGYKPNAAFEQRVLNMWRQLFPPPFAPIVGMPMGTQPMGMPMLIPPAHPSPVHREKETVITFNPKELLLLEKAFDNRLTERDTKNTATKCTPQDKVAAQAVIRRAQSEFVMRGPSRKRKPKSDEKPKEVAAKKVKADALSTTDHDVSKVASAKKPDSVQKRKADAPTKKETVDSKAASAMQPDPALNASPVKKTSPTMRSNSTPSKKEREDDDVPISKMVSAKKHRRMSTSPKEAGRTPALVAQGKGVTKAEGKVKKEQAGGSAKGSSKKHDAAPKRRSKSKTKK